MSDAHELYPLYIICAIFGGWVLGLLTETIRAGGRCPHCERDLPS